VTRRDAFVPGDHPQGRRLAAARRAEEAAIGPGGDPQVDGVDSERPAVALGEGNEFDLGCFRHGVPRDASALSQGTCQPRARRLSVVTYLEIASFCRTRQRRLAPG